MHNTVNFLIIIMHSVAWNNHCDSIFDVRRSARAASTETRPIDTPAVPNVKVKTRHSAAYEIRTTHIC
jgi:hypothetical protein